MVSAGWLAAEYVILISLIIVSAIGALCIGTANLSIHDVINATFAPLTHSLDTHSPARVIIWQVRMPRVIMEMLVGASLAITGTAFQALLRNDLAEPYTVGVSAGASVGANIVLILGLSTLLGGLLVPAASFLTGTLVIGFLYASARRSGKIDVRNMLLMGVVASAFLWAVQTLLLSLAGQDSSRMLHVMMGSLENASWPACAYIAGFGTVGAIVLASNAYGMNLYALGEISAQQLGLDVERYKRSLIIAGSLVTAATVAFSGVVAFVGLVVPHIARRIARTPDHRIVLPLSAACGALMMIWSDTIARVIMEGDRIPVGVVTAFWGGPFFWWLLKRQK
jgi:iron complex transport system permease protein